MAGVVETSGGFVGQQCLGNMSDQEGESGRQPEYGMHHTRLGLSRHEARGGLLLGLIMPRHCIGRPSRRRTAGRFVNKAMPKEVSSIRTCPSARPRPSLFVRALPAGAMDRMPLALGAGAHSRVRTYLLE